MVIGLVGTLINNENLGCCALTYSLINLLEKIAKDNNVKFRYNVFEFAPNEEKNHVVSDLLGLNNNQIYSYNITPLFRLRRFIHYPRLGVETIRKIKECQVIIDLTSGDSFTDIYGQYVFDSLTNVKKYIIKHNIPLILGPQTYGPFNRNNEKKAKNVINSANLVISRDELSKIYLDSLTSNKTYVTTDLAFSLPYHKKNNSSSKKTKVGINISGLLLKDKNEKTDLVIGKKINYEEYLSELIGKLINDDKYEVYIIPHVGRDGNEWAQKRYGKEVTILDEFSNPIDAKSFISTMDVFIGSRMHATIAALSSGVPTIPVAYSRKFKGLFSNINYNYVIDLTETDSHSAFELTYRYIIDRKLLQKDIIKSLEIVDEFNNINYKLIKTEIMKYVN